MAREKRDNNFNIIRFVAAIMVMAGHMAYIGGYTLPTLWGEGIQALGVKIFFLIGGFLIAKSWESDSNPVRYMTKRVFRIFPALTALGYGFVSNTPGSEYAGNNNIFRR